MWLNGATDEALEALRIARELSPSHAFGHYSAGFLETFSGDPLQATPKLESAMKLSPFDPFHCAHLATLAIALPSVKRLEEAAQFAKRATLQPNVHHVIKGMAALILAAAGQAEPTCELAEEVNLVSPTFGCDEFFRGLRMGPDQDKRFKSYAVLCGLQ